jgi:hypothetical protein
MPRFETIFEDSLFEQFEKTLEKKAQQADNTQNYQLALRMLDNLSKQSADKPNTQFQENDRGKSQPKQSDLVSIDAFISYLANNRFPYNGTPIAIVAPGTIPNGLVEFKSSMGQEFAVNTTGLIAVLQEFQNQSASNLYFKELTGKLIDDVKMDKQLNVPADSFQTPAINEATGEAVKQTPGTDKKVNDETKGTSVSDKGGDSEGGFQHADLKTNTQEQGQDQGQDNSKVNVPMPLNPDSNLFSIMKMKSFFQGILNITSIPEWNQKINNNATLGQNIKIVSIALSSFNTAVNQYESIVNKQSGFSQISQVFEFNPNESPQQLVNSLMNTFSTFDKTTQKLATKEISELMNMAAAMTNQICLAVRALLSSPELASVIGKDVLENQAVYGASLSQTLMQVSKILAQMAQR